MSYSLRDLECRRHGLLKHCKTLIERSEKGKNNLKWFVSEYYVTETAIRELETELEEGGVGIFGFAVLAIF